MRNVRNAYNVEALRQSVRDNPQLSVRRCTQQLNLTFGFASIKNSTGSGIEAT